MDSNGGNFLNVVHLVPSSHGVTTNSKSLVKKTSENNCLLPRRGRSSVSRIGGGVCVGLVFLEQGGGSAPWEQIA